MGCGCRVPGGLPHIQARPGNCTNRGLPTDREMSGVFSQDCALYAHGHEHFTHSSSSIMVSPQRCAGYRNHLYDIIYVQVVCQYFLRGTCKFGDQCRNEHPRDRAPGFGSKRAILVLQTLALLIGSPLAVLCSRSIMDSSTVPVKLCPCSLHVRSYSLLERL